MITSDKLHAVQEQRGEYPAGLRPQPQPKPEKKKARIEMSIDTPFGSPYSNVSLTAIDVNSNKVVDSMHYVCEVWHIKTPSIHSIKRREFLSRLRGKGYVVEC